MTYFDPDTYNWKELKDEDATFMKGYNYGIERAVSEVRLMADECEFEFVPSVNKFIEEFFENIAEGLQEYLESHRVQMTAEIMDANEEYWEK